MNIERPAQPDYGKEAWYRGWEAGQDDMAMRYTDESWIAYKGGRDLDAPQIAAKSWADLLDAIDEEEDDE